MIPKAWLKEYAENRLRQVRERPLGWGGTWDGVDSVIIDALELRDIALNYPEPPGDVVRRWHEACCRVSRGSNMSLSRTLEYDGVSDEDVIHEKYKTAIDELFKTFEQEREAP